MSYAHADDELLGGRLSALRARLERAYLAANGKSLKIIQDKDAIPWGAQWQDRINEALSESLFLIPIITPCYIESIECRREFMYFTELAKRKLRKDTILPILFLNTWQLEDISLMAKDELVIELRKLQWRDWRPYTNIDPSDEQMLPHLLNITSEIGKAVRSPSLLAVLAGKAPSPSIEEPTEVILNLGEAVRVALRKIGINSGDHLAVEIVAEASRLAPEPKYKIEPSWSRVFCGALAIGANLPRNVTSGRLVYAFAQVMKTPKWKKIREENLARFHYDDVKNCFQRIGGQFSESTKYGLNSAFRRFRSGDRLTGDSIVRALLTPEAPYDKSLLYRWIPVSASRFPNIEELRRDVEDELSQSLL